MHRVRGISVLRCDCSVSRDLETGDLVDILLRILELFNKNVAMCGYWVDAISSKSHTFLC